MEGPADRRAPPGRGDSAQPGGKLVERLDLNPSDEALVSRLHTSLSPQLSALPGTVALLCVMIGTTSFDGLSIGGLWRPVASDLQDGIVSLGTSEQIAFELATAIGVVAAVSIIAGLYWLGVAGMRSETGGRTVELARSFAHTLIPIALAYVVAHYFGLLTYQWQAMARLISDPLGDGSNVFGTARATIDSNWISATGIWYVQIAALIAGHVSGLVLAHDRAIARWDDPRLALRSQYWMLAVMVAFTCLAL